MKLRCIIMCGIDDQNGRLGRENQSIKSINQFNRMENNARKYGVNWVVDGRKAREQKSICCFPHARTHMEFHLPFKVMQKEE